MDSKPQAIPSYTQWAEFKRQQTEGSLLNREAYDQDATRGVLRPCIHCGVPVRHLDEGPIRIGCRIKVWDKDIVAREDGTEEVKLKSRVVAVSLKGVGCPTCQGLMLQAEFAEMTRYEKANQEWMEQNKEYAGQRRVTMDFMGRQYSLYGDQWHDGSGMRLPGKDQPTIAAAYRQQCASAINKAIRPWMMAALEAAQVPQARRIPSKRVPYLDVIEQVLAMPKRTFIPTEGMHEEHKPSDTEILPDNEPGWKCGG